MKNEGLPSWLIEEENYRPEKNRDAFIDKSIRVFIKIISRIQAQAFKLKGKGGINSILKVICTVILLILTSLSRSFLFVLAVQAVLLVYLSLLQGEYVKVILGTTLLFVFFTFIILVPAMLLVSVKNNLLIILKVFNSILALNILSYTTKWHEITSALKFFFIPDLFIFIFDITIKYILVLSRLSVELLQAMKLRAVGKSKNKQASLAGIMGTVFLHSKEMSEEMYGAMECRGFTGEYERKMSFTFTMWDGIYLVISFFIIMMYLIIK